MKKRGKKANSHSEFLFNKQILNSKCSQSQVVASVLLILLVIVSIMVIVTFIVPFIKDQLSGTECIDLVGQITIKNNPDYTCYDSVGNMSVQIHVGDVQNITKGFQIAIEFAGSTTSVDVIDGATDSNLYMLNASQAIEVPGKNEERTYIITNIGSLPDSVSVYPILESGGNCDASDVLNTIILC